MKLKYECNQFLLNSNTPWIKYNLEVKQNGKTDKCKMMKTETLQDERIVNIIQECKQWPNMVIKRHNDAKHIIHKIGLLLDLGLDYDDEDIKFIADLILSNHSEDGAFLSLLNIAKAYGGTGEDNLNWIICDFPLLLCFLIRLGLKEDERVEKAIKLLISMAQDNGWRCVGSVDKFRGPGRKADFCPYGTLLAVEVFSLLPEYHDMEFIKIAIDTLLGFWKQQGQRKIYMFGIGTDFRKLKYPNIWFDIVHVLRVLSRFKYAIKQKSFEEMMEVVINKQLESGGFVPESIYMAYKCFGFGQKKVESEMLTFVISEIFDKYK